MKHVIATIQGEAATKALDSEKPLTCLRMP